MKPCAWADCLVSSFVPKQVAHCVGVLLEFGPCLGDTNPQPVLVLFSECMPVGLTAGLKGSHLCCLVDRSVVSGFSPWYPFYLLFWRWPVTLQNIKDIAPSFCWRPLIGHQAKGTTGTHAKFCTLEVKQDLPKIAGKDLIVVSWYGGRNSM